MIQDSIANLVDGLHLSAAEAESAMDQIMAGEATPAQIGGYLVALRIAGETPEEIALSILAEIVLVRRNGGGGRMVAQRQELRDS